MNYYTRDKKILEAMETIFDQKFANNTQVNFAVSYSERRKMTLVCVQVVGVNFYHVLLLIFTKSLQLYDVVKYYKNYVRRYGILSKLTPPVDVIKKFISRNIQPYNPITVRKLREEEAEDTVDFKIEKLKNQIERLKNQARACRDEKQNLKKRIALLNRKNKS